MDIIFVWICLVMNDPIHLNNALVCFILISIISSSFPAFLGSPIFGKEKGEFLGGKKNETRPAIKENLMYILVDG